MSQSSPPPSLPLPNILITGTPCCGKTSLCARLSELCLGLHHINVGELVREKQLHEGWDDDLQCYIVDEDKLCDELESVMSVGGVLCDYHCASFFPVRWFSLVVVLRCSTEQLHTRLSSRGYSTQKREENIEAEIMQVCLDEVREGWDENMIIEMINDTVQQQEDNCNWIQQWVQTYQQQRQKEEEMQ